MDLSVLPPINAGLNATAGLLLIAGVVAIVKKNTKVHALIMLTAVLVSVLFLTSYLYYHFFHGATVFPHQGWIRPVYFSILISHTILAVVIVPLVIVTVVLAFRKNFEKHVKWARVLFPMWLYVSVTGVVIYWMLYQL